MCIELLKPVSISQEHIKPKKNLEERTVLLKSTDLSCSHDPKSGNHWFNGSKTNLRGCKMIKGKRKEGQILLYRVYLVFLSVVFSCEILVLLNQSNISHYVRW